mgnify:CR=1 FL=1
MTSTRTLARIAGSLYLAMAVCAGFAELYVRSRIVESGDAAATADNIRGGLAWITGRSHHQKLWGGGASKLSLWVSAVSPLASGCRR